MIDCFSRLIFNICLSFTHRWLSLTFKTAESHLLLSPGSGLKPVYQSHCFHCFQQGLAWRLAIDFVVHIVLRKNMKSLISVFNNAESGGGYMSLSVS